MALNTITLTPNLTKKHVMVTTQRRCQFQPRGLHESLTWLLMHCLCSSKREVFFFSFCKQCPGWQPSWISDQHKKLAHIYKATTGLLLPGYLWLPSWISDQQQKIKTLQWVSEWVIIVQWQHSNFSAISWREKVNVNFQWDNDEVLFVLDQYA